MEELICLLSAALSEFISSLSLRRPVCRLLCNCLFMSDSRLRSEVCFCSSFCFLLHVLCLSSCLCARLCLCEEKCVSGCCVKVNWLQCVHTRCMSASSVFSWIKPDVSGPAVLWCVIFYLLDRESLHVSSCVLHECAQTKGSLIRSELQPSFSL